MDHDKIKAFYERIQKRYNENTFPEELKGLITHGNLLRVYNHILDNKESIEKKLSVNKAIRFDKYITDEFHTFNLILDPNDGEIRLVLETKQKNQYGERNDKTQVFSGTSKVVKPAWAIDGEKPQKMANAVIYLNSEEDLVIAQQEADVFKKIRNQIPNGDLFLNSTSLGVLIEKPGIKKEKINGEEIDKKYTCKKSFYSFWADLGTLDDFLSTEEGISLSYEQKSKMVFQLAIAMRSLHSSNIVHQDIKPQNILVFRDGAEGYRLELADFGGVYDPTVSKDIEILTTLGYESPEISVMQQDKTARLHEYYYDTSSPSFGRELAEKIEKNSEYLNPDKANDMWSLGIVIYQLFFLKMPESDEIEFFPPLILSLLEPNRSTRLTAQEMFEWLQKEPLVLPNAPLMNITEVIPEAKVTEFFARVADRLKKNKTQKELKRFIKNQNLKEIYAYIISKKTELSAELRQGKPCRLDKKLTGQSRTVVLVFEPTSKQIMLLLETKRKNKDNQKTEHADVFTKQYKSIKPAWRIDEAIPQKMVNEVYYLHNRVKLADMIRQVNITTEVSAKSEGNNVYLNTFARGKVIEAKGQRENFSYRNKLSYYYPWPLEFSLADFLNSEERDFLTTAQIEDMAEQLITAVKALHDEGMVHKNIKTENILVYLNAQGNYCLKISCFSELYEKTCFNSEYRKQTTTSRGYESPEISSIFKEPKSHLHRYYHNERNLSLGREGSINLTPKPEYNEPHNANDAWALGIVLYELFYRKKPTASSLEKDPCRSFISGLLNPIRDNRATAQEALLALLFEKGPILKKEPHPNIEALELKFSGLSFNIKTESKKPKKRGFFSCLCPVSTKKYVQNL